MNSTQFTLIDIAETLWMRAEALHNICARDCNYLSSTFHFVKFAQSGRAQAKLDEMSTIAVPVIENLRPIDVPMIKNGPSMYLNDKKWPIDVPIKTGTPIHVPHFRKKKGPIDVPGSLILRPMFAAHPYNHFCTEYPPPGLPVRTAPWKSIQRVIRQWTCTHHLRGRGVQHVFLKLPKGIWWKNKEMFLSYPPESERLAKGLLRSNTSQSRGLNS